MKATKWKLTWLPEIVDLVPLQLWDFGPLITKKKPEEDDDIADLVNPQSVRDIFKGTEQAVLGRAAHQAACPGRLPSPLVSTELSAEGCDKPC